MHTVSKQSDVFSPVLEMRNEDPSILVQILVQATAKPDSSGALFAALLARMSVPPTMLTNLAATLPVPYFPLRDTLAGFDIFEIIFSTKLRFGNHSWLIQLPLRELKKALSETVGETSEVALIER